MIKTKMDSEAGRRKLFSGRVKDVILVGVLGLILTFAVWKIFYNDDNANSQSSLVVANETEKRISRLLQEIEGVGEVEVMICETEEGVQSVVVVCEGANDLQVIMNVREAVSAALGAELKSIKIYVKKK